MMNRIKYFRKLRRMTMRELGMVVGFPKKNADVRIAQYESEDRVPKTQRLRLIAEALDVSPYALSIPNVEDANSLMHLLFMLEDRFGFRVEKSDDSVCLRLKENDNGPYGMLLDWQEHAALLMCGAIDQAAYDQWRYGYNAEQPQSKTEVSR